MGSGSVETGESDALRHAGHQRCWRRTALLGVALLAALFCGLAALPGGAWAGGWTSRTSGTSNTLYGVAFVNASDGWTVGDGGTILATSDGGAAWRAQSSGTSNTLYGVAFADASKGWAVGDDGSGNSIILATGDGGSGWNMQYSGTGTLYGVAFADASKGWAVGDDGSGNSLILATSDGGSGWSTQVSGTGTLRGVAFVDASNGWAVGYDGSGNGLILATTNGGASWNVQTSGVTTRLESVAFANASDGWAVGLNGVVLATTNGGATWSAPGTGTASRLFDVACCDAAHVWAVGSLYGLDKTGAAAQATSSVNLGSLSYGVGVILATTDGGLTWGAQAAYSSGLYGVAFSDAVHGWVVGDGGTIMAYTCAAPSVTVSGADSDWHKGSVTLTATATVDASLSLSSLEYSSDGGATWADVPGSGSTRTLAISDNGTTNVTVRATDSAAQTATASATVKIDTVKPRAKGKKAVFRHGVGGALWIYVAKHPAGCGSAKVNVRIYRAGTMMRSFATKYVSVNHWTRVRMTSARTARLAPGSYVMRLRAVDKTGNRQSGWSTVRLTVK